MKDLEGVDEMGVEVPEASPVPIEVECAGKRLELVTLRHVDLAKPRGDAAACSRAPVVSPTVAALS